MLVLTTSTLVIENSEKAILVDAKNLEQVTCIRYLIAFLVNVTQDGSAFNFVLALLDLGNQVNTMHLALAKKLGLVMQTINVNLDMVLEMPFLTLTGADVNFLKRELW